MTRNNDEEWTMTPAERGSQGGRQRGKKIAVLYDDDYKQWKPGDEVVFLEDLAPGKQASGPSTRALVWPSRIRDIAEISGSVLRWTWAPDANMTDMVRIHRLEVK